ncbi:MAG: phosphate acyltransferase PlsX [Atribacterota bacterium]
MRIAVDVWGGDFAPLEIARGLKEAYSAEYTLVALGPREELLAIYRELAMDEKDFPIEDAPQVIHMQEHPAEAVKRKPNSSICRGIQLLAQKKVDAFISAGNSGAVMAAAWLGLKHIAEVERPAITALIPNTRSYCVLLDVGANVDCKPKHLFHFGVMGAEYAKIVLGIPRPRVGLLSIGEEEGKGNELVKAAYQLFKERRNELNFEFVGNAEGQNIVDGTVDVVVCDGFTGNAILKFGEGLIELIAFFLEREIENPVFREKLRALWKKLDRSEYGGAPLLGVEGVCLICHGKSKARDIKSAILRAKELVEQGILEKIRERLSHFSLES